MYRPHKNPRSYFVLDLIDAENPDDFRNGISSAAPIDVVACRDDQEGLDVSTLALTVLKVTVHGEGTCKTSDMLGSTSCFSTRISSNGWTALDVRTFRTLI